MERNGSITGSYECSETPMDAEWIPCNIVGTITFGGDEYPSEATLIENGNILVAGYSFSPHHGFAREYLMPTATTGGENHMWSYTKILAEFVDVEEKGIINLAKIIYANSIGKGTKTTLAGICLPILQATITPPHIVATKTVEPQKDFYEPGDIATYTITFTNTGGTATGITIIDQIPGGIEYYVVKSTSGSPQFSNDGGTTWNAPQDGSVTHIKWVINQLALGASGSVSFSVKIKDY